VLKNVVQATFRDFVQLTRDSGCRLHLVGEIQENFTLVDSLEPCAKPFQGSGEAEPAYRIRLHVVIQGANLPENRFERALNLPQPGAERGILVLGVQPEHLDLEPEAGERLANIVVKDFSKSAPLAIALGERGLEQSPAGEPAGCHGGNYPRLRASARRAAAMTSRATRPYLSSKPSGVPDSA